MEAPCQRIVWDVLPAIRAAIAIELVNCGVSQARAARMLEIAPSAVSQYLAGKRGYRIEFDDTVKQSVRNLAQDIKENDVNDLTGRICDICRQVRRGNAPCGNDRGPCGSQYDPEK